MITALEETVIKLQSHWLNWCLQLQQHLLVGPLCVTVSSWKSELSPGRTGSLGSFVIMCCSCIFFFFFFKGAWIIISINIQGWAMSQSFLTEYSITWIVSQYNSFIFPSSAYDHPPTTCICFLCNRPIRHSEIFFFFPPIFALRNTSFNCILTSIFRCYSNSNGFIAHSACKREMG